ncbi:MAG: hypothetical protein K2K21_09710, partial [Lachnospiraceae bacterium]|nr:hypothetical protein [Lachnospiraceae bacterium]
FILLYFPNLKILSFWETKIRNIRDSRKLNFATHADSNGFCESGKIYLSMCQEKPLHYRRLRILIEETFFTLFRIATI